MADIITCEKQRYYFDANALWKFYRPGRKEDGSQRIRYLVSNEADPILVSPLTLLEFFGILMKYRRKRLLKSKAVRKLARLVRHDTGTDTKKRSFAKILMPDGSFRLAENTLLQYAYTSDISSNDALHLAIVKKLHTHFPVIVLVTSDNSMKHICEKLEISCYDPQCVTD